MKASTFSTAVPCDSCHVVPAAIGAEGHIDTGLPAEVTFGQLAVAANTEATWDVDGLTCTVYCHGAASSGGTVTRPRWTQVDGSQVSCGSCHGLPPGGTHPQTTDCTACHARVVNDQMAIADTALHINGTVEVEEQQCTACHGSSVSASPPPDTQGNTSPSSRGVGAHRAHLQSFVSASIDCIACHIKPAAPGDPGHTDTPLPAEVTFGDIARGALRSPAIGLTPAWDGASLSCSGTYCHALDGAADPTPSWTAPTPGGCTRCHGLPPAMALSGNAHPTINASTPCKACHGGVVGTSNMIIAPARHINGVVDFD